MRRSRLRAFTLIEILVVVAIIGLLVGITMPSLGAARRVSRKTACQHNLHQIGAAVHEYLLSNKDKFFYACRLPSAEMPLPSEERLVSLPMALHKETTGRALASLELEDAPRNELFLCPADRAIDVDKRFFDTEGTSYEWWPQLNGLNVSFKRVYGDVGAMSVSLLRRDVMMISDFEAFHGGDRLPKSQNKLYADLRVDSY